MEHVRPTLLLDRRPLYPELVTVGVPRGYAARLRARARGEGKSVSALVRDAIAPLVAAEEAPR